MPHQILQRLCLDPSGGKFRAEGVAVYMGRNGRERAVRVQFLIPFHRSPDLVFDMLGYLWISVLVQHQETAVPVHDPLHLDLRTVGDHALQTLVHLVRHGDIPLSAGRLGLADIIGAVPLAAKLVFHPDPAIFKIQIVPRQSAELADPESRPQQHHKLVIVLLIDLVRPDELHPCLPCVL